MRIALVLLALTGTALADPPSVSSDGKRILVPYVGEDGARGQANLTLYVEDRAGKIVKTVPVIDAEKGGLPGGAKAQAAVLASAKWEPMSAADDKTKVSIADGAVTLTPPGHAPIVKHGSWRVTPDLRKQAEIDRASENGDIACFNAAEIGATWIDVRHRAAVVFIRYHGNDTCWEPDSDFAVVTW